jgi:hypothetical protein
MRQIWEAASKFQTGAYRRGFRANSELLYPAATLPVGIFLKEKSLLEGSVADTPSLSSL